MLHVKDHNALLPTSSIGDCVVEYQRLPPNEKSDKWIPLQGVKKGEIHVQVTRKIPELRPRSSFDSESSSTKSHLINTQVEKHLTQHFNLLFIASPQSPPLPHPPKPNKRKKKTHTHTQLGSRKGFRTWLPLLWGYTKFLIKFGGNDLHDMWISPLNFIKNSTIYLVKRGSPLVS